ncbi:MAG: DEAD/DEAH box helicase [Candidatus Lokiarchaeota archaeon]|nr:DEAD/DEAH box helicase [Candidatus Lokiarchaeota archaeon]
MNKLLIDKKPQNIFLIADRLQKTYKNFVKTFQEFQNPVIQNWVNQQMETKDLLYKDPFIELNFQFEKGKNIQTFVKEGILQRKILDIFQIEPYKHQSEAIKQVCRNNKNIIVSTGTGSGKSICFWIPIINTCLEMNNQGLNGIKAIVIFPMNALANSQYNIISKLLDATGIKIGRYTGDTAYSKEEAIRILEKNQSRKPYDSELLSRDEIRESPPDILITNYVMLDLILTRFEDRELFPELYKENLRYLVLDEIHTYSGNSGADVAGLIRRLKQRTNTNNKIRCIGTSATIQDNKKSEGISSIIEFAQKIFGEKFDNSSLIQASFVNFEILEENILPLSAKIEINDSELKDFDGTLSSIIPIAEKLLGRALNQKERSIESLGILFHYHPLIIFLRNSLKDRARALNDLAIQYQKDLRRGETIESCLIELKATFLLGTIAKINIQNEQRPLLVPKLHIFFTQGQEMYSCITKDGPHLSIMGDFNCKICEAPAFPLYFCRNCGHEFFSVYIIDNNLFPRTFDMEESGEMVYLTPITNKNNSFYTPDNWLDSKGNIRKTYEDVSPERVEYCPKCNKINPECSCSEKLQVWKIPYPLQLCPSCNIYYTKKKGEYGKLFSFNSTGRSSSTDILTMETIKKLSKDQKKQIIFTDNRQDTALQAEHLNEFQRRVIFRQFFYKTLKEINEKNHRISDIEIGRAIYQFMKDNNLIPEYQKEEEDEFSSAPTPEKEFIEYLTFLALSDVMQSQYFLDLNLDKLGLLNIEYDGLEKLIKHNYITEVPIFKLLSEEERYDYFRGILDIFRWNGAIANQALIDTVNKYEDWQSKFNENILFDINKSHYNRVGFAFKTPERGRKLHEHRQRIVFKSISWYTTTLINWTKKYFSIDDYDKVNDIIVKSIDILEKAKFLDIFWTKNRSFKLYQIREGKILFNLNQNNEFLKCPKCQRTYQFKKYKSCVWRNCPELEYKNLDPSHFYLNLYQQLPDSESEIHAKEHSAQVEGTIREQFENDFQSISSGTTNVLVCTPTMELGIDIGELSAIMMRNVPPDPSRYAQRAGRAGRKNQPSIVLVFCGTGVAKGPHDQYFYNEPEKIISGKINPPNFLLDNKKLIKKHIHAAIIETLKIKIPQKIGEILNLEKQNEKFPFHESFKNLIINEITSNFQLLIRTITSIFENEVNKYSWFTETFIKSTINQFYPDFNEVLNDFRDLYNDIFIEMNFLHNKSMSKGLDLKDKREYDALSRRLNDMRNGNQPFDTFGFLRNYGFLPNYAFPSDTSLLTMYDSSKPDYHDNWRSSVIAIREFAPYNQVYFLGSKYNINKAMVRSDRGEINVDKLYICESCNEIIINSKDSTATSLSKCPYCEEEIKLSNFKSSIHFPHMYSISGPRITCDEENRQIKGYEITINYKHKLSNLIRFEINCGDIQLGLITYEHNGKIYVVNKGSRIKSKTSSEIELQPFNFCSACGQWLHQQEKDIHIEKCSKKGKTRNLYEKLWLFIEGNHDVVEFNLPIIGEPDINSYYTTLKETIIQSLMLTYNLDESELMGFLNPLPGKQEQSIIIFETEEGGTGVLKSLLDILTTQFDKFIENMFRILHLKFEEPFEETMDACVSACYNCLLRFRNQYEHRYLNRKIVTPLIKQFKNCDISRISIDQGIDITNKIKIMKERCDSELEKKVLDEIVKLKLPLPDEVQKTYFEDDIPITKADFFYHLPKNEIYVFVDGPPHTPDHIQKEDREKRDSLESKGFSVVELDFKDGNYQDDPTLIEKEISEKLIPYLLE